MDFTSQYTCPTRLVLGGGEGQYGLCAMELLTVMTGDLTPEGKASDWHSDVNETLNALVITVNDCMTYYQTDKIRTDTLWPILPSLLGTGSHQFPKGIFLEAIGESLSEWETLSHAVWRYAAKGNDGDYPAIYGKMIEALKLAISMQHSYNATTPLPDYTPEHMDNLNSFLSAHEGDLYLTPPEVEALVPSV